MKQALTVSQEQEAEGRSLFVNMPAWMAYKTTAFPVGQEGVPLMPSYVDMSDFIWANSGHTVEACAVAFANVRSPQPYWYGAWRTEQNWDTLAQHIRASEWVYLCLWQGWDLRLIKAGGVTGVSVVPEPPLAVFDGGLTLWDAAVAFQKEGAELYLQWTAEKASETPDLVFVHLLDDKGQLVTQADGAPLAGLFPFWLWRGGEQVRDVRWLHVPGGLPPGTFTVNLGLYDPATGARRTVYDATGNPFPNDVVPALQFTVN
jgi:hypothetical protein